MNNKTLVIDDEYLDYAFELEKEWRKSQPKYTDKELLAIFPEAKEIIPVKISEFEVDRVLLVQTIANKLSYIKREIKDDFTQWFWREWIKATEGQKLFEVDTHISRLKHLLWISKNRQAKKLNRLSEDEMSSALQVPIETLLSKDVRLRRSGSRIVCLCPLHEEHTPSFFIYPDSNTCWCFGCNQGGNSINLVRLLHNYSFKEAVNYLNGNL